MYLFLTDNVLKERDFINYFTFLKLLSNLKTKLYLYIMKMINNLYYPYLIVCVKTHVATRKQMRFELLLNVETEFSCKPAGFSPKQKSIQNLWITKAFFHFKN